MSKQYDPQNDDLISLDNLATFKTNIDKEIDKIEWSGTKAQFDADSAAGKIADGAIVNITDDYEDELYYTQKEVNQLIGSIPKFSIALTSDHTTITNPSKTTIYLQDGETGVNLYSEWIYTDAGWHKLGEQPVTSATISEDGTLYV